MTTKVAACSFLLLGVCAPILQAGSMATILTVAARYDNAIDFNPLPFTLTSGRVTNGQPGLYQIDVSFTAVKDAGEKGWANTLFDLAASNNLSGSNLSTELNLGWVPFDVVLDTNGALPGGIQPIYGTNLDAGVPGDLKAILISIAGPTIVDTPDDSRNQLGTPLAPPTVGYPTRHGTFFVTWNGIGAGDILLTNQQFSFTTQTTPQSAGGFSPVQIGAGALLGFGAIPEPGTISLFGVAIMAFFGFVRHR